MTDVAPAEPASAPVTSRDLRGAFGMFALGVALVPIGLVETWTDTPWTLERWWHLAPLAVLCALASSVLPFSVDVIALRLLPAGLFSTLQSMHPMWAALVGLVILGQQLAVNEMLGIALVVVSNVLVTSTNAVRVRR